MDVFSLGCTLAEIYIERPLFDLPELLKYRNQEKGVVLEEILKNVPIKVAFDVSVGYDNTYAVN